MQVKARALVAMRLAAQSFDCLTNRLLNNACALTIRRVRCKTSGVECCYLCCIQEQPASAARYPQSPNGPRETQRLGVRRRVQLLAGMISAGAVDGLQIRRGFAPQAFDSPLPAEAIQAKDQV